VTTLGERQRDRHLPAEHGDPKGHFEDRLQVLRRGFGLSSLSEDGREDVTQAAHAAQIAEVEIEVLGPTRARRSPGSRPTATHEGAVLAHPVVFLALVVVGQRRVRLGDFLEALARLGIVGIGIRVVLLGQAPVGLLDLGLRRRIGNAEYLIEVLPRHVQSWPWPENT
jgi:hypothetical protein